MTAFNTIKPQSTINGICGLWQSNTTNTTTPYRGVVLWYARRSGIKVFDENRVIMKYILRPEKFPALLANGPQRAPGLPDTFREYLNMSRHSLSTEKRAATFPDALAPYSRLRNEP